MDDESKIGPPPKEGVYFRAIIGMLALIGSLGGFAGLYLVKVPPENKEALLLALGIVFGWGSAVVQSEFGATTTGRRVADAAVKRIEQENQTAAKDADAAREKP